MTRLNAAAYLRVASRVVADQSDALAVQEAAIRLYCNTKDLNLEVVFKDEGVSGLTFDRPGWAIMKEYLRENKGRIRSLILYDYSRMGRHLPGVLREIKDLQRNFGVTVHSIRNPQLLGKLRNPIKRRKKEGGKRKGM